MRADMLEKCREVCYNMKKRKGFRAYRGKMNEDTEFTRLHG